jgi:thiol-disulfide isomerase/thioredoxin
LNAAESMRVPWLEDVPFKEVVNSARTEPSRPILIDFYAQWCKPCKLLDVMVYNEDEVIAELADVLTFKVDIDKPEYAALKQEFNITVLPTLVWLDERGRELDRFTGYQNKDEFLVLVRTIRQGGNTFYRLSDRLALRPEDPGLLFELARRHAERGDTDRAEVLYRRLMGQRFKGDRSVVTDGMLGLAAMEQKAGRHEHAVGLARRAAAMYSAPDSSAVAALMAVAEFQYSLRDTAGVLGTYRALIDLDETDPMALTGYMRAATLAGRDLEQATRYGLRATVYSGHDARVMADLARCYARRELYHKARRWMDKAVEKEPSNKVYQEELAVYVRELEERPWLNRGRRH